MTSPVLEDASRTRAPSGIASVARWAYNLLFAPATPGNLGFCRLLFFALMTWFYWKLDYTVWGNLPASFQNANPILIYKMLGLGVPAVATLAVMQAVFKVALVLACVGLLTRVSCFAALISGAYVIMVPHTFGKTGHGDGNLVLAMLILAFSRCGDAWSIDAVIRSWRGARVRDRVMSGEYTWPTRCVWLLTAMVFLAAGIAKLRLSGFSAWAMSDNMANVLLQHKYKSHPPTNWGVWIAQFPILYKTLAALTIIVEVAFPLALISRYARWVFVPSMFLMQVGIGLTMGVWFIQFMFIYLFWVPWDSIGRAIQRVAASIIQQRAVFFDGGCGFCRKTVAILDHLDVLDRTDLHDAVNDWAGICRRFPQLERSACLQDMHVVTESGQVYRGYDAYRSIAWSLPAAWVVLPILYLPPVRWIGWKVYRHIADHRHDAGCEIPPIGQPTIEATVLIRGQVPTGVSHNAPPPAARPLST
jgi:predicted DCC family thiol-disulfide oxidoreductase YuxK